MSDSFVDVETLEGENRLLRARVAELEARLAETHNDAVKLAGILDSCQGVTAEVYPNTPLMLAVVQLVGEHNRSKGKQ